MWTHFNISNARVDSGGVVLEDKRDRQDERNDYIVYTFACSDFCC